MSSNETKQFFYGGQAVIEGVMMRGAYKAAIAVRDPDGDIQIHEQPLNATVYRSRITRTPFVRGLVGLWDALGLGTKALMWSANVALQEGTYYQVEQQGKTGWLRFMPRKMTIEGEVGAAEDVKPTAIVLPPNENFLLLEKPGMDNKTLAKIEQGGRYEVKAVEVLESNEEIFSGATTTGIMIVSLAFGIGLFFGVPVLASSLLGNLLGLDTAVAKNAIEEIVKVILFIGYILLIGQMEDVKRLFMYHGAEHKTINAYEAGAPLTPESVKQYPLEHPRCGTAFLLNVIILSMVINSIIGRPDNILVLVGLRILVIPVVAGIAYEWLRFTAKHTDNPVIGLLIRPNMALQRLTTREPDLTMIEVAIRALEKVLVAEGLRDESLEPLSEKLVAAAGD